MSLDNFIKHKPLISDEYNLLSPYSSNTIHIHPFSKTDLVHHIQSQPQLGRVNYLSSILSQKRTLLLYIMPDYNSGLGHRPVVRKLSATSNDLFKKFGERRDSTDSSSNLGLGSSGSASTSGTTTPSLLRSRPGSVKKIRSKAEVSF